MKKQNKRINKNCENCRHYLRDLYGYRLDLCVKSDDGYTIPLLDKCSYFEEESNEKL